MKQARYAKRYGRRARRRQYERSGAVWAPDSDSELGLVLWLDNSLVTVSGGLVTAWPDLSGLGNHGAQANPALQPAYEATGWNGTQSSVAFTAASNHVIEANGCAAGFSGEDKPFTINWAMQRTLGTETGECYVLGLGQAASALPAVRVGQLAAAGGTRNTLTRDNAATERNSGSGSNAVTTRHQITTVFDGTTQTLYVDGVSVATSTTALGTITFDRFYIGKWRTVAGYNLRTPGGQVYNTALSAPNLALLWQWNRDHFGGLP